MYKGEVNALEAEELDTLLDLAEASSLRTHYTVRTLARTGMRASEFAHLRRDWLDESRDPPVVRIPAHEPCGCSDCRQKADGADDSSLADYWKPKSGNGARTVPVAHDRAWEMLRDYLDDNGSVQVGRGAVWARVNKLAGELDVDGAVSPHILRHTYGTLAIENGMDINTLQSILGHSNIANTQVYVRLSGRQVADAAAEAWG